MTTKKWRKLLRNLRKYFPVGWRVVVIRRPIKKECGNACVKIATAFDGSVFTIRIDSTQNKQLQVDALLHEWAHILAMDEAYSHKGRWGEFYGSINEIYHEKIKP